MRFKYYLRGIGIGVTLATFILTVSFYFGRDFFYNKTLSDEEIIGKATALGMVMPEGTDNEETVNEENTGESEVAEEDLIAADASIADEEVPLAGQNEAASQEETSDISDNNDETVTYTAFTVKGGESSEVICGNLKKAGLVEDSDDFNKYLHKCKVDNRIQNGTFYVKQGSSYDDLIAILVNKDVRTTTPPKN